ncbi:MAG: LysR family transcriptional regulator ArgP [Gammaproteobacteria bacterium]|nr:LysR family transcriptional regulator ArgP [Gammaproteobacteria bacterium]MBU1507882.1 LysR family transcriptional regulator ArgP [Gammaproteobacteria bacterium]MBU2121380.1 LysR family transcriptional regulator ArgP [Gammaproteobacteria bacterium]MBU2172241.1 LysR family transcriptional regulator ArgP [Gammaproteobacteria bacterium]MBU2200267.1 LysR family transcriptional regulator ArgP [Gammaproteobacteria bacterium]
MSLDSAQLSAFATVIDEGSFERAASVLHITRSAVSQRVKLLEERVGQVLVRRATPCTPTDAGQALYRHAREVALSEADALASIGGGQQTSTRLAIGVNADSLATWFPHAMAQAAEGQSITFDINVEDQDHSANLLREGRVMAAVTADPQPVQGCKVLPLGTLRYRALASPAFMQRHFAQGVNAAALATAPMLVFNRKDALQARFVGRITRRKLTPPVHWLPEANAFVMATRAGLGWGMTPDPMVQDELRAGTLVELIADKPVDVPLYWQYWRLNVQALQHMTDAVQQAAALTLVR